MNFAVCICYKFNQNQVVIVETTSLLAANKIISFIAANNNLNG